MIVSTVAANPILHIAIILINAQDHLVDSVLDSPERIPHEIMDPQKSTLLDFQHPLSGR